jgi:hypothetical protein
VERENAILKSSPVDEYHLPQMNSEKVFFGCTSTSIFSCILDKVFHLSRHRRKAESNILAAKDQLLYAAKELQQHTLHPGLFQPGIQVWKHSSELSDSSEQLLLGPLYVGWYVGAARRI